MSGTPALAELEAERERLRGKVERSYARYCRQIRSTWLADEMDWRCNRRDLFLVEIDIAKAKGLIKPAPVGGY